MNQLIQITNNLYLREIDSLLSISPIVTIGKNYIHISDIILTEKDNFSVRALNPSCEIVTIEKKLFEDIKKALSSKENMIIQESPTLPQETYFINLPALKANTIFLKVENDKVVVNNIVFTNSKLEFKGSDLLTNKKGILLTDKNLKLLKNYCSNQP